MVTIVIFLRFVTDIRGNIHVNPVALIRFCSVHDTDDPDELGLNVPQSETLFHDKLPRRRRYGDINGDRFHTGERSPRQFDFHPGGII